MKRIIIIAAVAVMLMAGCKKQTFNERVLVEVEYFNTKEAPKRLDAATTFDSMQYDANEMLLTYFYTIETDVPADQLPREEVKQELLRNLRHSLQLKSHKEHGVLFHYRYILQPAGETLVDCTFTPEDYK